MNEKTGMHDICVLHYSSITAVFMRFSSLIQAILTSRCLQ